MREHQQAFVQQVGEDCARCDMPFVLELLLYPLAGTDAYREDSAKRADEVLQSVEAFCRRAHRVDLFKLEIPMPAKQVPDPDGLGGDACKRTCLSLHASCGGHPWAMLWAGASAQAIERVVRHAARASAAAFLAGRARWADSLALWPDRGAVVQHLGTVGLVLLRHLRVVLARDGRPWQPKVRGEGKFARGGCGKGEFLRGRRPSRQTSRPCSCCS